MPPQNKNCPQVPSPALSRPKPPTGGTYVLGLPIDVPKQPRPYLVLFTRYSETLAENCYISELTVSLVFDTTADGIQLGIL